MQSGVSQGFATHARSSYLHPTCHAGSLVAFSRQQVSVCTARRQSCAGSSSVHVLKQFRLFASTLLHCRQQVCYMSHAASPGMMTGRAGCLSEGCQAAPYHLFIAWVKVQALAQSRSSCIPITHCHVSHAQPEFTFIGCSGNACLLLACCWTQTAAAHR